MAGGSPREARPGVGLGGRESRCHRRRRGAGHPRVVFLASNTTTTVGTQDVSESTRRDGPSPPTNAFRAWLAELRRRRVFRVVAVYGLVSLVVMQTADLVFPAIPLPQWSISLVLWMIILGFPIAVVLAWALEVTPDGVRRTDAASPEHAARAGADPSGMLPVGLLALVGVGSLATALYLGLRPTVPNGLDDATVQEALPTPAMDGRRGDGSRPTIAVLPFVDMSEAGDQEYFSDGISEEILTMLSRIRELQVVARSSAFRFKGEGLDLRRVGEELGVPYLLAGSVRRSGDRLRISAELVNADDGLRLWTETYDRRFENVFEVQTDIAQSIAEALRIPLGLSGAQLGSPTFDTEAHDLYLSARAAMRARGRGVAEAIEMLEAAIERDSTWAPAWAGLAEAYAVYPLYSETRGESTDSILWARSLESAEAAARRALQLDPGSASARVALGGTARDRWSWDTAEREFLLALEMDPDNAEAHLQYAELLWGMGRLDESLRETGRALALDRAPVFFDAHGFTSYMNGRLDEAEDLLEEGIARDPTGDVHFLRTVLAQLLLMDGRYLEALDRFGAFLPDPSAYRAMGEALERGDPGRLEGIGGPRRGLAQTWALLGDEGRALDVLEEAAFAMPFRVQYEIWDPHLAPLWDTRRFQQVILPRLNLEGARARFAPSQR